jgi:hypothetical protein
MLSLPEVPWRRIALERLDGDTYRVRVLDVEGDDQFEEVLEVVSTCLAGTGRLMEKNAEARTAVLTTSGYAAFYRNLVFEGVRVED